MWPTIVDAVLIEVEERDRGDAEEHRDQRAGHDRRERRSPSTTRSETRTDERASAMRVAEVAEEVPELLEEVAVAALSTPNSFGSWPTMIVSASPMMKPLSTGSEMKLARKPRRSSPARARAPRSRSRAWP